MKSAADWAKGKLTGEVGKASAWAKGVLDAAVATPAPPAAKDAVAWAKGAIAKPLPEKIAPLPKPEPEKPDRVVEAALAVAKTAIEHMAPPEEKPVAWTFTVNRDPKTQRITSVDATPKENP